jgi:hypothetical protein
MLLKGENQVLVSKDYQLEKMANSIKQIIVPDETFGIAIRNAVPDKIWYNDQKCCAKFVLGITAEMSCQIINLV